MKRIILPFLLLALCLSSIFATNPRERLADITIDQMQLIASNVLNDLKRAKGILATEPPSLKIREFSGSLKLAIFYHDRDEIHLDSMSYELMREMGKDSTNALAFLLGHELGHYLNKHKKTNHAIADATGDLMQATNIRNISNEVNTNSDIVGFENKLEKAVIDYRDTHDEAEADFEGGFLGYLAGYQPMDAGREFLKRAYDDPFMNLTKRSPGYPTFEERLDIIRKTTIELQELIPVFEMANYLVALEQYHDAIPYFEKVLEKFQSRELYNNIGVSILLEIMRLFEEPLTDYKFPFTLDASFRIPHPDFSPKMDLASPSAMLGWTMHGECFYNDIQGKILVAEDYFSKALSLDDKYEAALLNLSIAHAIKSLLFQFNTQDGLVNCSESEYESLSIALANAIEAKNHAVQSLIRYDVLAYSRVDSLANRNPDNDSAGGSIDPNAFRIEGFGRYVLTRDDADPHLVADSTRWITGEIWSDDVTEVSLPNKGGLLSNIYVQIDLVRILQGNLKNKLINKKDPLTDGMVDVVPFGAALEINSKNQIAKHNRKIALNLSEENVSHTEFKLCNIEKVEYENQSLVDLVKSRSNWNNSEEISRSKLVFDVFFNSSSIGKSHHRLQYADKEKYKLFVNTTEIPGELDDRTESCIVLHIKPTGEQDHLCKIHAGMVYEDLISALGNPSRSLALSNGSYLNFLIAKDSTIKGTSSDQPEQNSVFNQEDLVPFEVKDDKDIPSNANFVSETERIQDGIIVKLDSSNEVVHWAYYNRNIHTKSNAME